MDVYRAIRRGWNTSFKCYGADSSITPRKLIKAVNRLSKSRLSLFNALAATGGALAGGGFSAAVPTFIGVYSLACTAASINQLQEIEQDLKMKRTRLKRPLCTGALTPQFAKTFAVCTSIVGATTLHQFCGPVALLAGVSTVALYNCVYTPLKQKTVWNTEVGALVGALPPAIGIAGAHFQNGDSFDFFSLFHLTFTDPYTLALCAFLYIWQLPHFMALCYWNKNDYTVAGFEMLSKYDPDGYYCSRKAFGWSVAMAALPPAFVYMDVTTIWYLADAGVLSFAYALCCLKWFRTNDRHKYSKKPFVSGLILLPTMLLLMTIHSKRLAWQPVENTHLMWLKNYGIHEVPLHQCMLPKIKPVDIETLRTTEVHPIEVPNLQPTNSRGRNSIDSLQLRTTEL